MASTSTLGTQTQHTEGRTVRDVAEYRHELVNEVWCRKIFRQLLQSLELQYAAGMPHRAITPDTIVIQENGEPMLLPSGRKAAEQGLAADLFALAAVIHYAITLELTPEGPLRGRKLDGYSDSLLNAVDKCMASDPRARPQTVDELRAMLGMVAPAPAAPVAKPKPEAMPAIVDAAPPTGAGPVLHTRQRWLAAGLACVLLVAGGALVALWSGTRSSDAVTLTLPPAEHVAAGLDSDETLVRPAPPVGTQTPPAASTPAEAVAPAPPAPASTAPAPVRADEAPAAANTAYKLLIKPWGSVYVDGEHRGVSPPVKRLVLPAGPHTIRVVNPGFPDRVLRVEAGKRKADRIVHDFVGAAR